MSTKSSKNNWFIYILKKTWRTCWKSRKVLMREKKLRRTHWEKRRLAWESTRTNRKLEKRHKTIKRRIMSRQWKTPVESQQEQVKLGGAWAEAEGRKKTKTKSHRDHKLQVKVHRKQHKNERNKLKELNNYLNKTQLLTERCRSVQQIHRLETELQTNICCADY